MRIFKGKTAGQIVLMIAVALSVIASVAYLIFGLASGTFKPVLLLLPLAAALAGLAACIWHGFAADYLFPVCTALLTASLVLLGRDSIDDLTAFFVGMGDYFGNANNVGPRVAVAVILLLGIITAIIGSFLRQEKKEAAQ